MIVGELRIIPVGVGSSMDEPLERVVNALDDAGIKYTVGPLGTTLEAENLDDIFNAARRAHDALQGDVPRIVTTLTIDHRLDKEETASSLSRV